MSGAEAGVVRAAGCVLWRRARGGRPAGPASPDDPAGPASPDDLGGIEIALVHRPRWADWSHPKGKLKCHESARGAAVREVREETGMTCALGAELPTAHYVDAQGRAKSVRYWAAEATGGTFAPNREVDQLLWLSPGEARDRLTRPRDADLVPALLENLRVSGTMR